MNETEYTEFSEIVEGFDELGDSFIAGVIGTVLFGLINIIIAAAGVFYFLKYKSNMPYYDQFIAKNIKVDDPTLLIGAVGAGAALLQVILVSACEVDFLGANVNVSVHWLTWVAFAVYVILAAFVVADKYVFSKNQ